MNIDAVTVFSNALTLGRLLTREGKSVKLDPMATVIQIALLSFQPPKTKIGITARALEFHPPTHLQGAYRWATGHNHDDLTSLDEPLQLAALQYRYPESKRSETTTTTTTTTSSSSSSNKKGQNQTVASPPPPSSSESNGELSEKACLDIIFLSAIKGLEHLQATYSGNLVETSATTWKTYLKLTSESIPDATIDFGQKAKMMKEKWRLCYLQDVAKWLNEAENARDQKPTITANQQKIDRAIEKINKLLELKRVEFLEVVDD